MDDVIVAVYCEAGRGSLLRRGVVELLRAFSPKGKLLGVSTLLGSSSPLGTVCVSRRPITTHGASDGLLSKLRNVNEPHRDGSPV